jgi:spore coat polysaccharide biosynthesis protein SpsF
LDRSQKEAAELFQREHVTPYIYQNPGLFHMEHYVEVPDYSDHRWTLDTPEDWRLISTIYQRLAGRASSFETGDVLRILEEDPVLAACNRYIVQKTN